MKCSNRFYHIFIDPMWRRFGTLIGTAGSGTEEEFRLAYRAWAQDPSMPRMFYFCQKPSMPRRVDELDQLRQVLLFRQALGGKALIWEYPTSKAFPDEIRKHLCVRMSRLVEDRKGPARHRAAPNAETIELCKMFGNG